MIALFPSIKWLPLAKERLLIDKAVPELNVKDMELFFPYFRLLEGGLEVDIAAPKKGHIEGEHGYDLEVEKTFDDVHPDDYDLLLIPGGSPDGDLSVVRKDIKAQAIARSFFNSNKPVSSICHGPWLLASSGLVKVRRLTAYWHDGVPEDIKKAGGTYEDKELLTVILSRHAILGTCPHLCEK